ncbi:MAG: carnitine 3-dehydrogenase, partial [Gammaproteobacteria bacterium]|nr:carnitine 3-dehydrogenase [Gammaproteobacteria bacterium]
ECHAGDRVKVTTRVNEGEGKKLRLQQALHHADGRLLSTSNVLLIHVDLTTRKSCPPAGQVAATLSKLAAAHAELPELF